MENVKYRNISVQKPCVKDQSANLILVERILLKYITYQKNKLVSEYGPVAGISERGDETSGNIIT
jgi:hypothetical protein